MAKRSFTPALFAFLRELKENNTRAWFAENKTRYQEDAQEPAIEFVADMAPLLRKISPNLRADAKPVGGSLFRIHRDVRFSKDKSPYKTHVGIHFRHRESRDAHSLGLYLHLEPGEVFAAGGIWHPDGKTLARIRSAIAEDPRGWKRATSKPFADTYRMSGDSLKRPPPGFAPDHPLIDDLKRKDFIGVVQLSERDVTSGGFIDRYADLCRSATPLLRFLGRAVGQPV